MAVRRKKNIAGYIDEIGRFRPIRSPKFVGSKKRPATAKDKKAYSRDLGGDNDDVFDRQIRKLGINDRADKALKAKELRELERDVYGDGHKKGKTLLQFIRAEGGLTKTKNDRGELSRLEFKNSRKRGLVTEFGGKDLDNMFKAAREAGYYIDSPDQMLGLIDDEINGSPTYATHGYLDYRENPTQTRDDWGCTHCWTRLGTNVSKAVKDALKNGCPKCGGWDIDNLTLRRATEKQTTATLRRHAAKRRLQAFPENKKNPSRPIKAGDVITARSMVDYDTIFSAKVLERKGQFVKVLVKGDREPVRKKVKTFQGEEYVMALGTYSMAPIFTLRKTNPPSDINFTDKYGAKFKLPSGFTMERTNGYWVVKYNGLLVAKEKDKSIAAYRAEDYLFDLKRHESLQKNPTNLHVLKRRSDWGVFLGSHLLKAGFKTKTTAEMYVDKIKARAKKNPSPADLAKAAIAVFDNDLDLDLDLNDVRRLQKGQRKIKRASATAKTPRRSAKKNPIHPVLALSAGTSAILSALQIKEMVTKKAVRRGTTKAQTKQNPSVHLLKVYGRGEDAKGNRKVLAAYLTDNKKDGLDKKFKTVSAAKAFATRNKISLIENPLIKNNGMVKRYLARRKAASALKKELRLEASLKKTRARKSKAISEATNPKPVPRSRTFEMFQGRKPTNAKQMPVSRHAPAQLAQLGDLIELKLSSGEIISFDGKRFKLCAANGKLWIAGGKFAKADAKAKANELNPVERIDHVVYGTYKPHHGDHKYTHYIHKLGEETGHQPMLAVDRDGYPVIRGGKYKIEARGIVN